MYSTILFSLFYGCNNDILAEYTERKESLQSTPSKLSDNWKPDIIFRLNYDHLTTLAQVLVNEQLQSSKAFRKEVLGFALNIQPSLKLTDLQLSDDADSEHIRINGTIKGPWKWTVGAFKGSEHSSIQFSGSVNTEFKDGQVFLHIDEIQSLNIQINDLRMGLFQSINISKPLEAWLKEEILKTPPIPIRELSLPVRGARLFSTPTGEQIEVRSHVNHTKNLPSPTEAFTEDWQAWIHQDTLLGWAQESALELGTVAYGIAIDPRNLSITDQDFNLDLRLWKIEGVGKWWRDYQATGTIERRNNKIHLVGNSVTEVDNSPRAGLADPLALLGEGLILEAIGDNLNQTFPLQQSKTKNKHQWNMTIDSWTGRQDALVVNGSIEMNLKPKGKSNKSKGK
jgi:hypothetical protein